MEKNTGNYKWLNGTNIIVLLLGMLIMYFGVTISVNKRFTEIELSSKIQISEQETLLTAIAETTARNGADSVTEMIVKDCSMAERNSFDNLLGRLNNNLSQSELIELERLFGRCGTFFSERKTVMASRLSREIDIYEDYVNHLGIILGEDISEDYLLETWQDLANEEEKRSEQFARLVTLQDVIISTLLSGSPATSDEIVEILHEVNEVQEMLVYLNAQASKTRSLLISM